MALCGSNIEYFFKPSGISSNHQSLNGYRKGKEQDSYKVDMLEQKGRGRLKSIGQIPGTEFHEKLKKAMQK